LVGLNIPFSAVMSGDSQKPPHVLSR